MPGHRVPFSDLGAINVEDICPSCGFVLCDAVQLTGCGHLYCETCFVNLQRDWKSYEDVKNSLFAVWNKVESIQFDNEFNANQYNIQVSLAQQLQGEAVNVHDNTVCLANCGVPLEQIQSFPDECVRRDVLNLNVTCFNKDNECDWHGTLRNLEEHSNICPYRQMCCRNDGCRSVILARSVQHHEENCPCRQVQCQYCDCPETLGSLPNHLMTCPGVLMNCTACGKENIRRSQMKCHTDAINGDCPRKYCPFKQRGCQNDGLMDQATLDNHLMEGFSVHLLLLQRLVEASLLHSAEECRPPTTSSDLKQGLVAAESEIAAHKWALSTQHCQLAEVKEDVRSLFHALAQAGERFEEVQATNAALRQEIAELKSRVEADETQAELRNNNVNDQLGFTRACCGTLSRSVQDLRCQSEVHSYNGELVWIISDVSQKWAEARGNPDSFLASPPFYTSRSGYKARVHLYLNGHGREWGAKMSFYFVLMKGEYDKIVQWPFSRHIEFKLMGQGVNTGNDLVVRLQPHPQDASFARPVQGMNVVQEGAAHFAFPLEILLNEVFVDEDTMFVKVVMHEK